MNYKQSYFEIAVLEIYAELILMSKTQIYLGALLNLEQLLTFCVFLVDDTLSVTVCWVWAPLI